MRGDIWENILQFSIERLPPIGYGNQALQYGTIYR
jgi:hypothetical protein